MDRTREATPLNALLRWFWIGSPQTLQQVAHIIPDRFRVAALECGMLEQKRDLLVPTVMLLPVEQFLVAADHPSRIDAADADLVLWPNPTSRFLARFTIRQPSQAILDLGTGSGILSLYAAGHSESVIATDLNARAIQFAEFNARLNSIENIDFLTGDGFKPVVGRKFDLIFSNPPFFITPAAQYLFCDNPMELDQLCRHLVREAPLHLNEGGYFQMLCEWAQIKGQLWQERIAEWVEGTGCDVWIMKGVTQDPAEYAQHRISETAPDTRRDLELYEGYMDYYNRHGVEAIHDGLIVLRRRNSGANWVRMEDVCQTPGGPLGEMILATFAAHDFLQANDFDEKMLAVKLKLSPHVRLEQVCEPATGRWQPISLTLRLVKGFPFHLGLQPFVAEFLITCDGKRTTSELIDELAVKADAPLETVRRECLQILRTLIERGFILPEAS
jgi:hypothetical protein